MYRCQKCGKVTNPGDKENKIVTSIRDKEYLNKIKDKKNKKSTKLFDKVSYGSEIVSEISICDKCAGIKPKQYVNSVKEYNSNKDRNENKIIYSTDKNKSKNCPLKNLKQIIADKEYYDGE